MLEQSDIPEVVESYIGEAIDQRNSKMPQFEGLGPVDMITMVKYLKPQNSAFGTMGTANSTNSKHPKVNPTSFKDVISHTEHYRGEIGTFFYIMGIDNSDSTSIAVSLKEIADSISETPQPWFDKIKSFNVERISLSSWNSFRSYDVTTIVKIPGNLATFIVNEDGEEVKDITQADFQLIMTETYMSSVVRSISLMKENRNDMEQQPLVETLIFNPLMMGKLKSTGDTFIELFPIVYEDGHLLGSSPTIAATNRTNNYLVDTFVEIVKLTRSIDKAKEMLINLSKKFPEVLVVLIKILLVCEYEYDAFQLVNELLSTDYTNVTSINNMNIENKSVYIGELLYIQAEHLMTNRKEYKYAKLIAKKCVELLPNEMEPWLLLSKVYFKLNDIKNALYTLNCIPTALVKEKYILKRVVDFTSKNTNNLPRLHLPLPLDIKLNDIDSVDSMNIRLENESCDPDLQNLPATTLKPIFRRIYQHLTKILQTISWEELLSIRSQIFLMEEEYMRNPQTIEEINQRPADNKRLCERWLDNLFMIMYEDLRVYTIWRKQQLYHEVEDSTISHTTTEWELFGLCAARLGYQHEAASAFEFGLSQRFSPVCARQLLEYHLTIHKNHQRENNSLNSKLTSSKILQQMEKTNKSIINLCIKIVCWDHRWYINFSLLILEAMGIVTQDMGISKVSNEIRGNFNNDVYTFFKNNILKFFKEYSNDDYDV
ncbi:hypothetical protein TPHA_0J01610 [Tetrapisispora phaffii CBS 4417]|uniref:Bud site selection protein 7 n=1 Tax=Tetrapisispora phaffii (strain ATCC 24235 / CBS 4417 / NBRC 1672 / NRRL Y-8282 / UCD 70-5) TaxID=1071381 RepID=G8BYP0_TETPH|nr:hypothetical protein TPHA_0J01610 [Tetrapisispora phaffii CBS 4417]CCE64982.1 hypothetical protein TPHA_0J01610 [Tetrapisispora phaffii CBS 4417]